MFGGEGRWSRAGKMLRLFLHYCDNWRGISLLDVVGKVFSWIVQDRLVVMAEKLLPESQCGFRKGRGCIDMLFAARQLAEKSRERADSLFVDLKKAYDSVVCVGVFPPPCCQ